MIKIYFIFLVREIVWRFRKMVTILLDKNKSRKMFIVLF